MSGWFAMKRGLHEHPIFYRQPLRVAAWSWMLAKAAWKDTRQDANGKTVTVKRGQLLTSYRQMSDATGVSVKVLRGLIERLQAEHAIGTDTGTGRLLITICNYERYQDAEGGRGTGQGTGRAQEGHTKEQGNKGTRLEEAKASLSAEADETADAVRLFNETAQAQGWPQVRTLSKQRKAALRARLKEADGLTGWQAALARAAASDHCNGHNERGWVCNFDFLTRQSSFAKLMEGNFDNRAPVAPKPRSQSHDGTSAADIARRAGERWARRMDSGQGADPSQPLFQPRVIPGGSGSGD